MTRTGLSCAVLVLAAATAFAQVPAGGQIHFSDSGLAPDNSFPDVASDGGGNFVVVWSEGGFPPTPQVVGRRYDAFGAPRGPEFTINAPGYRASIARTASTASGQFVVAWTSLDARDGSGAGIFARRYDAAGAPAGPAFQVNTYITGDQQGVDVAIDGSGNFVVVWESTGQDGSGQGVFAQRHGPLGNRVGAEFRVSTYTPGDQSSCRVAVDGAGRIVVTWTSVDQDGSIHGVYLQRYDASGNALGPELQVNTYTTGGQGSPAVAADTAGNFVVVWGGNRPIGIGIAGQRFDSGGLRRGSEFSANTLPAWGNPDVSANGSGDFVVTWMNDTVDGDGFGVSGQRFDANGGRRGPEFPVPTTTAQNQSFPSATMDPAGNFVVAWHSGYPTTTYGVFGQRFAGVVPGPISVDPGGNGIFEAGENVGVVTSWRNESGSTQTLTGMATAFTGPGAPNDPVYTIVDGTANYGTVPNGATASCATTGDCYAFAISTPTVRPVLHWDATFREDILPGPQGPPPTRTLHIGDSFNDVPRSSAYYRFVETILHHDLTGGCGGGNFCPLQSTPREQMAVFVLVAKEGAGYQPPACVPGLETFADVPASSPFCRWIEELARRNIAGGCGGGNFCPLASVSREQMAVLALATKEPPGYSPVPCVAGAERFPDVPASSPFCKWIEELARRNIAGGCGGGNFCPVAEVTREQNAVFVAATFVLALY